MSISRYPAINFWGLKSSWWKQVIDGVYHEHGPLVFDRGLHGGDVEPGFRLSILKACAYASSRFGSDLDMEFYQTLHRKACSHFDGEKTATLIDRKEIGRFGEGAAARLAYRRLMALYDEDGIGIDRKYREKNDFLRIYDKVKEYAEQLNQEIMRRSEALGFQVFARVFTPFPIDNESIYARISHVMDKFSKEIAVERLFAEFHRQIGEAANPEEKLRAIANLYQMLEWLHPFADGQGRTDIILLQWLLCKYGFHPAILEDPYRPYTSNLDEAVAWLKQGLAAWVAEKKRIDVG